MTQPPPPPAGTPPPPAVGTMGPPGAPPPPFSRSGAAPAPAGFALPINEEQRKEERSANRAAMLSLAAKPEIIAIGVTFVVLWVAVVDGGGILAVLLGLLVFVAFGAIYMSGGDSVIASLQLGAIGILAAVFIGDTLRIELDSLLWLIPGVVVIACETGATYNNYRRRDGEISARITRSSTQNLVAIAAMSIVLASIARALTQLGGRVEWPWFAVTIVALALAFLAAMLFIRRSATPADTRRFNPGRRMLPPPRT